MNQEYRCSLLSGDRTYGRPTLDPEGARAVANRTAEFIKVSGSDWAHSLSRNDFSDN